MQEYFFKHKFPYILVCLVFNTQRRNYFLFGFKMLQDKEKLTIGSFDFGVSRGFPRLSRDVDFVHTPVYGAGVRFPRPSGHLQVLLLPVVSLEDIAEEPPVDILPPANGYILFPFSNVFETIPCLKWNLQCCHFPGQSVKNSFFLQDTGEQFVFCLKLHFLVLKECCHFFIS